MGNITQFGPCVTVGNTAQAGITEQIVQEAMDREEFRRARRKPCDRCGLLHNDYDLRARIYDFEGFDCEVIFPNIDDLVMSGNTILLPPHIAKLHDDVAERDLHGADIETFEEVLFVADSLAED